MSARRSGALDELSERTFDLLVVGAGIVGARVAYEAARAGLRVALVDAGDIGGATSSASSKLIHGGLRYLATGSLGLVRACQRERRILAERLAPHLVQELPLVLVVERGSRRRLEQFRAAMPLYAALSGFREPPRRLTPAEAQAAVPPLRTEGLAACALVSESQTNDARLTLATARGAARAGAVVATYVRVVALDMCGGRVEGALAEDVFGEGLLGIRCRAVVNAAGPWVDELRRLEDPRARPRVRLSKGVHALLPLEPGWDAGLAVFDSGRSIIATPWQGMLMLGVTDTPYEGNPGGVGAVSGDVDELLAGFRGVLPDELLRPERVRATFAGLRVLPPGREETAAASREHVLAVGPAGIVSVAGGKLTTQRLIAVAALHRLPAEVRPGRLRPSDAPLPGAGLVPARPVDLDPPTWAHLIALYGSEAGHVVEHADGDGEAFEPIHPDGPDVWAQVSFAAAHEWAQTVDDVVRRRTTLGARGLATAGVREKIQDRLDFEREIDREIPDTAREFA